MRKELYNHISECLSVLYTSPEGDIECFSDEAEVPEGWQPLIRHIDLWNHNVEFIEQEEAWPRPAVFIEFAPIDWSHDLKAYGDYRGSGGINLHIVTDWQGSTSHDSPLRDSGLHAFDILESVVNSVVALEGPDYGPLIHARSLTNHDHEDIVENIESFTFKCYRP